MSIYLNQKLPQHKFYIVENTKHFACYICDKCKREIIWYHDTEKITEIFERYDIPYVCKPYIKEEEEENIL